MKFAVLGREPSNFSETISTSYATKLGESLAPLTTRNNTSELPFPSSTQRPITSARLPHLTLLVLLFCTSTTTSISKLEVFSSKLDLLLPPTIFVFSSLINTLSATTTPDNKLQPLKLAPHSSLLNNQTVLQHRRWVATTPTLTLPLRIGPRRISRLIIKLLNTPAIARKLRTKATCTLNRTAFSPLVPALFSATKLSINTSRAITLVVAARMVY